MYLIPPTLAWFGRYSEQQADRFAAEIGYGTLLIESLNSFLAQDENADMRIPLLARLMASHPPLHDRIRRIEEFEQKFRASSG